MKNQFNFNEMPNVTTEEAHRTKGSSPILYVVNFEGYDKLQLLSSSIFWYSGENKRKLVWNLSDDFPDEFRNKLYLSTKEAIDDILPFILEAATKRVKSLRSLIKTIKEDSK